MNISLTPELEKVVRERVESGLYNNASEVIREALRDSLRRERESDWLVREVAIGYVQLQSGATVEVSSKEEFKDLVRAKR
jgi:antitoxin ParD1/3/4